MALLCQESRSDARLAFAGIDLVRMHTSWAYVYMYTYLYIHNSGIGREQPNYQCKKLFLYTNINIYNSKKLLGKSSGWVGKRWVHSHEEDDFEGGN